MLISEKDLETGRANGCGFCNPLGNPGDPKAFVLPSFCDHRLNSGDRLYANKNAPGECGACGSRIHIVEKDGSWKCADCRAPVRKSTSAQKENQTDAAEVTC
jgi:predicted RNA-binding Zn-ribbon protein involved in translation (DUF1610 family)